VTLPMALVGVAAGAVVGTAAGLGQTASVLTTGQFIRGTDGKVVNPVSRGLGVTGAVAQYLPIAPGRNQTNITTRVTPAPSADPTAPASPPPAKKKGWFSGGRSTRRRSHH